VRRTILLLVALAALLAPAAAIAHPLGNFTVNRYSAIELSGESVYLHYVVDLAEIPTVQFGKQVKRPGYAEDLARGLELRLDGRRAALLLLDKRVTSPAGVAGLRTTRLEAVFEAETTGTRSSDSRLSFRDTNFGSRRGWQEIVVRSERGARISRSSAPEGSRSDGLRAYPEELLQEPLSVTSATVSYRPGSAAGEPPRIGAARGDERSSSRFEALIAHDDLSLGFILVALAVALFWGAAHALTPGHGKAIIAGYMIGTRGRARHALMLGGIVTVTHTIGVFTLGLITLGLSEFVVPEQLYPWLNLVAALLVVGVGMTVLRSRYLAVTRPAEPHLGHHHGHGHHNHGHGDGHGGHEHSHVPEPGSGVRGLLAVGISGGILPCPTALVVLLAAISLQRVAFGLLLIVAFSLGIAAVISGIGLLAVGARRTFRRLSFEGPVVRALPAVSALLILGLGLLMTVRALPAVS